jgi:hypothetical protein
MSESEKLCRTCLRSDPSKLVNIFKDNIDSIYCSVTQLLVNIKKKEKKIK